VLIGSGQFAAELQLERTFADSFRSDIAPRRAKNGEPWEIIGKGEAMAKQPCRLGNLAAN
jgi:hypothetical protein